MVYTAHASSVGNDKINVGHPVDDTRKTNAFVRTLIVVLCVLLLAMAGYRFLGIAPAGRIDGPLLAIIGIVVILVLSESFDNFSVGKFLTISREIKKKEEEVKKLETQNAQLLAQVLTIATSQQQSQSHISVSGDYHNAPVVQRATEEEVTQVHEREDAVRLANDPIPAPQTRSSIDPRKFEQFALEKYTQTFGLQRSQVLQEAKLVYRLGDEEDPIARFPVIFDAYMQETSSEVFVEFKMGGMLSSMSRYQIYVMLIKLSRYAQRRNTRARLDVVMVSMPSRSLSESWQSKAEEYFSPAVSSGILRFIRLEMDEAEEASIRRQVE